MNKAFYVNKQNRTPQWHVIDASGQVVGRLATKIAEILRGKDEAYYTPHADAGDYVVVTNIEKIVFTGDKMEDKEYVWYTGWIGGQKRLTAKQMIARRPEHLLRHAVKGMLPKNTLADHQLEKLKIYKGDKHPHAAQMTK